MSITTDRLLIVQLANWINENLQAIPLPVEAVYVDQKQEQGDCFWLQPLAASKTVKQYVDGSYIGQLSFAAYFQRTAPENMAELDVPLWNLGEFFEKMQPKIPLAHVQSIAMTSTPCGFARYEDGTFINQSIFILTYRKEVA